MLGMGMWHKWLDVYYIYYIYRQREREREIYRRSTILHNRSANQGAKSCTLIVTPMPEHFVLWQTCITVSTSYMRRLRHPVCRMPNASQYIRTLSCDRLTWTPTEFGLSVRCTEFWRRKHHIRMLLVSLDEQLIHGGSGLPLLINCHVPKQFPVSRT